ncbi:MAG: type II toxin-antitoxin system VapC family toxin [Chthoniobacterales bacterium]
MRQVYIYPNESDRLEELLEFFPVLDFTRAAVRRYGEIRADLERKGRLTGPLDLLIAAHARKPRSHLGDG